MTAVTATFAATRALYQGTVSLVPTMGFFHEGHLALMRSARSRGDTVVVSLFVNPLQFNDPADLKAYPSDLDRDVSLAAQAGVDVVFAPDLDEVYPEGAVTTVHVPGISEAMEGEHRPGHFDGVATVVSKLLAGLRPDVAVFGKKDAQQLALVRRMATDLRFPTEISGYPTVREIDGIALSSRNVFLSAQDRRRAMGISSGLFAAADLVATGEREAAAIEAQVRTVSPDLPFEYVVLASQDGAMPIRELDRPAFLATACRIGSVRLIDNVALDPDGTADRGVRLVSTSMLYGEG